MNYNGIPVTFPTRISELEFNTVMDTGFFGEYTLTPEIHSHPYYELLAALQYDFRVEMLDGDIIEMNPGYLCIIPPGRFHATCADGIMPEKLAVRFSFRKLKRGEDSGLYRLCGELFQNITAPVKVYSPELCVIMKSLRQELLNAGIASNELVQALFTQLYIGMIRLVSMPSQNVQPKKTVTDDKNSRYYKIEIFFTDHYNEQITENDLAVELGLSKRQLSRILRSIYGMSFREKLIDTRMSKALVLLRSDSSIIDEIANSIGYTSPSGFHIAFKKRFGVSAGEYRRLSREK